MKTYICTKKIRTQYNKIKSYVIVECDPSSKKVIGKPRELTRREVVTLIRDIDNSRIVNLCLTYNNRVTHFGPLSMKAKDEQETNS